MRIFTLMIATVLMLPLAAMAHQGSGYIQLQYADDAELGFGLGASYDVSLADEFTLEARLGWLHFGDIDLDMVPVEAAVVYTHGTAGEPQPYVGTGVGLYVNEANRGDVDDEVGWFVLGGIMRPLDYNTDLFVEARWLVLEPDVDAEFAANEGTDDEIDLGGIGVSFGLVRRW